MLARTAVVAIWMFKKIYDYHNHTFTAIVCLEVNLNMFVDVKKCRYNKTIMLYVLEGLICFSGSR